MTRSRDVLQAQHELREGQEHGGVDGGADGERLDVDLSGQAYDDDEPTVGLFELTNEGVGGEVRFPRGEERG